MKIACVYHGIDLDGWMSAAIVKHWFETNEYSKECCAREMGQSATIDEIEFIGYNYGQPVPDLSEYDKVIMVDICLSKDIMEQLFDKLGENLIWIDHHKSALEDMFIKGRSIHPLGKQNVTYAACELTWQYFFPNEPMPEIVRLLGRYDCFGHKGTDEELKVLEFQYGARTWITNVEEAYLYLQISIAQNYPTVEDELWMEGKAIYQYLCTEAKQSYKNGFEIEFVEQVDENTKYTYKFICINKERFNPINFGIDYHKDGYDGAACFHYANGMYNFSLYNDNGLVDCSVIAKQFGGGGHKGAAGFTTQNINQFINQ